jgi:low affinity Fe/Cu permease
MGNRFSAFTKWVSSAAGSWQASLFAFLVVLAWIVGGFYFGFTSELYQLVINTFTTIVTFLLVFLIQHTQNSGEKALNAKIDGLIAAIDRADDRLIDLEDEDDREIDAARREIRERKEEPPG